MEKDPEKIMKRFLANSFMLLCVITAFVIFIGLTLPVFAQVPPGGGTNPCPGGDPCDPEVPITGIEWLLIAGGLFGFRKVYYKFRKS